MNRRAALACLFLRESACHHHRGAQARTHVRNPAQPPGGAGGSTVARTGVGEILSGSKPATTPVDMQMRVRLFVNERTLRELGLLLPTPLRLRADRVVD